MATATAAPASTAPAPAKTAAPAPKGATKGPDTPADGDEAKGKASAPAVDPNAGKTKYVVEGKEFWLTPEQKEAYVTKGIAFEPKISDLARLKQETAQFQQALINNPGQVLANLATQSKVPLRTIIERVLQSNVNDETKESVGTWYYENVVKRAKMDEKDRAILERDEKIASIEAKEKKANEDMMAKENLAKVQAAERMLRGQLAEAMKEITIVKDLNTPLGVMVAKRVFDVMRMSYQTKTPITPKAAAEKVQAEMQLLHKIHLDDKDDEALIESIGKENAEKVRKYFLKIVKAAEKDTKEGASREGRPTPKGERKTLTPDEFHELVQEQMRAASK